MNRKETLEAIADTPLWDVLVIGGGASGFGAAVDAASRGFKTLLVEANDFGKGTSSRSTKLVHGGVRYLQQGRIGLVREALHERGLLLRNAPHLCRALPFIVPSYGAVDRFWYGAGLKFYDLLSGSLSLGHSKVLGREAVLQQLPTLSPAKLDGGILYYDGQFDDARLVIALAHTLRTLGGHALNYAPALHILHASRRVAGAVVRDEDSGREFTVRARAVINAAGVFCDSVRRLDDPNALPVVMFSQGSHLVVSRSFLPGGTALMIPKTTDGRVLFAIPWHDHVVIGTTDIPVPESALDPKPLADEVSFILQNAARYLARAPSRADVLSAFAGLRPLVRSSGVSRTADVSRGYSILVSGAGLVTLTGGKWTTYRKMGETAVDRAITVSGLEKRPSRTAKLALHGAGDFALGDRPKHWSGYGSDMPRLADLAWENKSWWEPLHPDLPYLKAEVIWAVRQEMARTVDDVLARRTRALFLHARAAMECAPTVANLLATELHRPESWARSEAQAFQALASRYLL